MKIEWRDTIISVSWAIVALVGVIMLFLFIMQASAESARFWEACVNSGGMTVSNNCIKALPAMEIVK